MHCTTIFYQDLPKTSYYKLMDWWLIISGNSLVYTMAVHTYLDKVIKREANKTEQDDEQLQQQQQQQQQEEAWTTSRSASAVSKAGSTTSAKFRDKLKGKGKSKAAWVNQVGKIGFIVINLVSNLIIGIVALVEYVKDPEDFLGRDPSI